MSEDDALFGYRLRVLDHAGRTSVSEACRVFGIHRSTYYVWKRRVERHGLEILRPRERRRPRMPQQLSPFVEERIVAFALGTPVMGRGGSRASLAVSAGAGSRSATTASGAVCVGTASTPAPSDSPWSPATPRPTSRRARLSRSGTSKPSVRANWSGSTVSSSAGSPAPEALSGS